MNAHHRPPPGFFLTLEGGEGAGKSTLARGLASRLEAMGRAVVKTREPGGSPKAEVLRHVILSGAAKPLGPFAEAVLFNSARDDHLSTRIRPALASGAVVICDRFADSTRAYQGAANGLPGDVVAALEHVTVGPTRPNLTLILDIDPTVGLSRVARRPDQADRFETEGAGFHERLRAAYLEIARQEPDRCVVIDASGPPASVEAAAWRIVQERLASGAGEPRR